MKKSILITCLSFFTTALFSVHPDQLIEGQKEILTAYNEQHTSLTQKLRNSGLTNQDWNKLGTFLNKNHEYKLHILQEAACKGHTITLDHYLENGTYKRNGYVEVSLPEMVLSWCCDANSDASVEWALKVINPNCFFLDQEFAEARGLATNNAKGCAFCFSIFYTMARILLFINSNELAITKIYTQAVHQKKDYVASALETWVKEKTGNKKDYPSNCYKTGKEPKGKID